MKRKTLLTGVAIVCIVLLVCVYAIKITKEVVQDSRERKTQEVTERESARSTGERAETFAAEEECALRPKQREFTSQKYYTGPLVDAHVHMPVASKVVSTVAMQAGFKDMPHEGDISSDEIVCIMKSEGIRKIFGFYIMPNIVLGSSVQKVEEIMEKHAGTIAPFFMPPPINSLFPGPEDTAEVFAEKGGLFRGYGEVAFYMDSIGTIAPDDPEMMQMYALAEKYGLMVMIHPDHDQKEATERVLQANPGVKFHIHGQDPAWTSELVSKFPNVFISLDAQITSIYGFGEGHQGEQPTKEEWLAYVRGNFDTIVNDAVREWKPLIEQYPDRFMWASDRWYEWHFEYEVGGLIEEISRSFIAQLNPGVQEKYAYQNAEAMIE